MSHRTKTQSRTWRERALSLFLAAVMLFGLLPGLTVPAEAHWADGYLDQLVDWGIIRPDQTTNPDAPLTRAEFTAIVNRAYGYTEVGPIPFTDVVSTDWFYDDVAIAYTAGYMAGTSATTASPNASLTREQAVCILGRNMMLKSTAGESLAFTDSRSVSDWARGTIKTAVDNYIVSGYPDNTFQPLAAVSKAQMAVLITQCLGTPVSQSGTYELGGVFGNVTITAPDVTLRNTTISGDLYISGGVGLGGIKLENVNVLGRIIVSSSGESESGDASVIMRNVNAREMLVDNMRNKTVTIRADGITEIGNTIVRTSAYLEDNNTDDKGLLNISLEGEPGIRLTLAGRIKNVVNKTPQSTVQVAKGTVAKLTVDEKATNSTVQIDRNAEVKELNLDVGTNVIGEGDIGKLNVNAPGSVVTMLPDKIYIRPGLDASIGGIIMDSTAAEEGSTDPRLLSGYPAAKDIAPTSFRADFSGNKKGTVFWAVSSISDGSIGEEELINPPSYGSKAIQGGSVAAAAGNTVVNAQVTGLTVAGSYYLSALLRDEQGRTSPVKVISFSTPDNTVPAFAQGYPYMSRTTRDVAQVTVMPTKTCKLYYALLPQGAQAPTVNELKSAAVIGNLGYGVRDVTKNTEDVFTVNNQRLEELKNYVLYLWLTDVNGANSSAVQALPFVVPDETPPEFVVDLHVDGNAQETTVPVAATLNENGTIYWAVVESGAKYPLPNMNSDPLSEDNEIDPETGNVVSSKLDSEYAKLCVKSGMGALARGQTAAQGKTEVKFNITGLKAEKAYDLYYLAQDTAGNYTIKVYKLEGGIHTKDVNGPVITQSFTSVPSRDDPNSPWASTDIVLEFSENIRCSASGEGKDFLTLYNNKVKAETAGEMTSMDIKLFLDALKTSIVLYRIDPESQTPEKVATKQDDPAPADDEWVVDYSKVTVTTKGEGRIVVTFPGTESAPDKPAVRLANGEQYFFRFNFITDTSPEMNPVDRNNTSVDYINAEEKHSIKPFTTAFSKVYMRNTGVEELPQWKSGVESGQLPSDKTLARNDITFRLSPQSTKNTDPSNKFDILIYTDTSIDFDLYYRITNKEGEALEKGKTDPAYADNVFKDYTNATGPDANGWYYLGSKKNVWGGGGVSVGKDFNGCENNAAKAFPELRNFSQDLYYEFVISITKNGEQTKYENFSDPVKLDIYVEAGRNFAIAGLADELGSREEFENNGMGSDRGVANIGLNQDSGANHLEITKPFTNTKKPEFKNKAPWFSEDSSGRPIRYEEVGTGKPTSLVGDTYAYLFVNLDIKGTIHYVVSEETQGLPPTLEGVDKEDVWEKVPTNGEYSQPDEDLTTPGISTIAENNKLPNAVASIKDSVAYPIAGADQRIYLKGLKAETKYYIYFVLESEKKGNSPGERSEVHIFKFKTAKTTAPRIRVDDPATGSVTVYTSYGDANNTANVEADLTWRIMQSYEAKTLLKTAGSFTFDKAKDTKIKAYYTQPAQGLKEPDGTTNIGGAGIDTLYEALCTEYHAEDVYTTPADLANAEFGTNYNGYTLFDLFASDTQRAKIQRIIDLGEGVTPLNNGEAETRQSGSYTTGVSWISGPNANIKDPEKGTYLFLIAGHNLGSNTGSSDWSSVNSFRLRDNVKYTNKDAPALVDQPGGVKGSVFVDPTTQTISASVSLLFNKDVYWKKDSTYYKVDATKGTSPTSGTVGIMYGADKNTNTDAVVTPSGENPVFSLNFSNIKRKSSYFTLLGGGGGAIAANGGDTAGPIQIAISYREVEERATNASGDPIINTYWVTSGNVSYNGQYAELDGDRYLISSRPASISNNATAPVLGSVGKTGPGNGIYYNATISLPYDQAITVKNASGTTVTGNAILGGAKYTVTAGETDSASKQVTASVNGRILTIQLKSVPFGSIKINGLKIYDKATGTMYTPCDLEISVVKSTGTNSQNPVSAIVPKLQVKVNGVEK